MPAELGDPAVVELPAIADDSTQNWLKGDGAAAVTMVSSAEALLAGGAEACDETIDALDSAGTPEALLAAAASTPDQPTQEMLIGLHTTLSSTIRACDDPDAFETSSGELAWQTSLVSRRLEQIGVR